MRVAIAGAGNVGLFIANDLAAAGHEVQLIEQNPDVVQRSHASDGVEWLVADACEVSSLRDAVPLIRSGRREPSSGLHRIGLSGLKVTLKILNRLNRCQVRNLEGETVGG